MSSSVVPLISYLGSLDIIPATHPDSKDFFNPVVVGTEAGVGDTPLAPVFTVYFAPWGFAGGTIGCVVGVPVIGPTGFFRRATNSEFFL